MNDGLKKVMFLEDISNYIRFSIYAHKDYENFINVKGKLKNYFKYNNWDYMHRELLEEITGMIVETMIKGKSFMKIKYYYDNKKIKGIELRYISHLKFFKLFNKVYVLKRYNSKYKIEKYNINECIFFKSKDIGIKNLRTKRMLKKLSKYDETKLIELSKKRLLTKNFEEEAESEKIKLLKICKDFSWEARQYWPEYLNSPYILYRKVKWYQKMIDILEKSIEEINKQISIKVKVCKGHIVPNVKKKEKIERKIKKYWLEQALMKIC